MAKRPPPRRRGHLDLDRAKRGHELVPSWRTGDRDGMTRQDFLENRAIRVNHSMQLVSDGLGRVRRCGVRGVWPRHGLATLVKQCRASDGTVTPGAEAQSDADVDAPVSCRYSKKAENHAHALSIYFMNYGFCRIHETPQVDAGDGRASDRPAVDVTDLLRAMDSYHLSTANPVPLGRPLAGCPLP